MTIGTAQAIGLLVVGWLGIWVASAVLVWMLPDGKMRRIAVLLPGTLTLCRRLLVSREVGWRARIILAAGVLYAVSPITLIPDFVPVVGKADNVAALYVALRLSARIIPRRVVLECWPGDPARLRLILGAGFGRSYRPGGANGLASK